MMESTTTRGSGFACTGRQLRPTGFEHEKAAYRHERGRHEEGRENLELGVGPLLGREVLCAVVSVCGAGDGDSQNSMPIGGCEHLGPKAT